MGEGEQVIHKTSVTFYSSKFENVEQLKEVAKIFGLCIEEFLSPEDISFSIHLSKQTLGLVRQKGKGFVEFQTIEHEELVRLAGKSKHFKCNFEGQRKTIYLDKPRIRQMLRSQTCAHCGKEGIIWKIVRAKGEPIGTIHLNLFAKDGTLLTWDHIIPRSKGGDNSEANSQTLCGPCNFKKSDK